MGKFKKILQTVPITNIGPGVEHIDISVMVFGLCLSAIAGINYVLKNRYPYIITITIIVMAVATEFGAYYRICKYAKLED